MATITSVGTGAWSASGTWDSGVPADGDDVVIASGHTVTFDVDQSAFTTGVKVTITGTLTHATTTGTYRLFAKTGASIVGAGTWNIGTSGTPIPFSVKHTITGAAGWYVDGVAGLTMTVYGAEPSIKYVKLSGDEAIGQTELSVDTDVTGDIWADGDTIRIDNINKGLSTEERVIAAGGIAAGTITITSGLTAAKITGAIVSLITRNIKIIAVGTGTRTIYRVGNAENKLTIQSGMFYGVNKYMFDTCNYMSVSGGTFSRNNRGLYRCNIATISGGTFSGNTYGMSSCNPATISGSTFSGGSYGLYSCAFATISGSTFSGNLLGLSECPYVAISGSTFSGNTYGSDNCLSATISGSTFSGNNYGLSNCPSATISGSTFSGNTYDLNTCSGNLHDTTLTSATEHNSHTTYTSDCINCQSEDHDGNDGALKAWCGGGVVTSQTSTKPDGYTQAYTHALESASSTCFFTKTFSVEPSKTVSIEVQLRKDSSMSYPPRVYLVNGCGNPILGATAADSFTMTDSTDTWESDTFSITNSTDYDQEYTLWFVAKNASGNAYSAYEITTAGGTGGGLLTHPSMTGGMRG